jgi:hypothetical protein
MKTRLKAILQFIIGLVNGNGLIQWFIQRHLIIPHQVIQWIFPLAEDPDGTRSTL